MSTLMSKTSAPPLTRGGLTLGLAVGRVVGELGEALGDADGALVGPHDSAAGDSAEDGIGVLTTPEERRVGLQAWSDQFGQWDRAMRERGFAVTGFHSVRSFLHDPTQLPEIVSASAADGGEWA